MPARTVTTCIALLRGINVGGRGRLSMQELKRLFEEHGCADVQTYIQSGNVVFRAPAADLARLPERLTAAILTTCGFEPIVLVLTLRDVEQAAAANPYKEAAGDPNSLHLFFLAARPAKPNLDALERLRASSERFALQGRIFYLHAPDGIGRSKVAQRAERLLGVAATARNWRTITTLLQMAQAATGR